MQSKIKAFKWLALTFFLFMFFQNCGQTINFQEGETLSSSLQNEGDASNDVMPLQDDDGELNDANNSLGGVEGSDDSTIVEDLNDINLTCDNGEKKTVNYNITFEKNSIGCAYGIDGNLEKRNGYIQARLEATRAIQIPENTTVCDLQFETDYSSMRYDDHIIFTLDDVILATSTDELIEENYFSPVNGIGEYANVFKYKWENIAGQPWNNSQSTPYCLGEAEGDSVCQLPKTEQVGQFILDIGEAPVQRIMALNASKNTHEFKFIVTGDNDLDCVSSAFSFDVEVTYVEKGQ